MPLPKRSKEFKEEHEKINNEHFPVSTRLRCLTEEKAQVLQGLPEDVWKKIIDKMSAEGMDVGQLKKIVAKYKETGTLNL